MTSQGVIGSYRGYFMLPTFSFPFILPGDDSVYLNRGDVMLQSTQGSMLDGHSTGAINSPSMHFSNKHWQTFQVPANYIKANWPLRVSLFVVAHRLVESSWIQSFPRLN